jgi:cytochrome b561
MTTPKRYHPVLVTLHWLTVVFMLGAGFLADEGDGGGSPVNIHMILGAVLLVLIVTRLIVRFTTKRPAWADTGSKFFNMLGELVHYALYLLVFYILGMGALLAYKRDLFGYLMGTGSIVRGVRFFGAFHQLGWFLALLLVAGHVGAALYHQFILKDNLLGRMWYGK